MGFLLIIVVGKLYAAVTDPGFVDGGPCARFASHEVAVARLQQRLSCAFNANFDSRGVLLSVCRSLPAIVLQATKMKPRRHCATITDCKTINVVGMRL